MAKEKKRMRIFAGPNGSGKTTIIKTVSSIIDLYVYVNADDIERQLKEHGSISFSDYSLLLTETLVQAFLKTGVSATKHKTYAAQVSVTNNKLSPLCPIDSYLAADLAELIRQQLMIAGISFSYETVMSHESKIAFLKQAQQIGYKVYLYYVATEDPEINVSRVNVRVTQKGHFVAPEIIRSRYKRSLANLKAAIRNTNRAYIFDNSSSASILFAEITEGEDVKIMNENNVPNWFMESLK